MRAFGLVVLVVGVILGCSALTGFGGGAVAPVLLGGAALGIVGGSLLMTSARGRAVDPGWTPPPTPDGPDPRPAGLGSTAGPVHQPSGIRPVVTQLGLVEVRELLTSPWYGVGIGISVFAVLVFGFIFGSDFEGHWWEVASGMGFLLHPLAAFAVIAVHRAVTRSRRDGCDELFVTCPVDRGRRLAGHLVPGIVAAAISAAFAVVMVVVVELGSRPHGALDGRLVLAVLTCAVFGAGAVALGVALGRWAPFFLSPVFALVGIAFVDDRIAQIGGDRATTDMYLATFEPKDYVDQLLMDLPLAEQLVWFLALAVLVAGLAFLGLRRWAVPVVGGAAVVAVVAAVGVVAPMGDVDRSAALAIDPEAHEACQPVPGGPTSVEVCGPEEYEEAVARHVAALEPTAAALPPGLDPLTGRLRLLADDPNEVPVELAAALPPDLADGLQGVDGDRDASFWVSTWVADDDELDARLRLSAAALGLPHEAGADSRPEVVAGRADGLAVLWLAALDEPRDERAESYAINPDDHAGEPIDATVRGQVWPDVCDSAPAALGWAPEDLEALDRLSSRPDDEVLAVLHEQWDDLGDLSVDELLAQLDLDPVGPPADVEARPFVCDY